MTSFKFQTNSKSHALITKQGEGDFVYFIRSLPSCYLFVICNLKFEIWCFITPHQTHIFILSPIQGVHCSPRQHSSMLMPQLEHCP